MNYFLDTAIDSRIEKWRNHISGVTSNPKLLAEANISEFMFYKRNRAFQNIFIQVNRSNHLHSSPKVIFKVPLVITPHFDGYELLRHLHLKGLRTCGTIVYTLQQFDYACQLGSEFCIVLCAKNEDKQFVPDCVELKYKKGYKTEIVAASFGYTHQVIECIKAGVDAVTVPPGVMEELFTHDKTLEDYKQFYGE